jgi:hypothetical protein
MVGDDRSKPDISELVGNDWADGADQLDDLEDENSVSAEERDELFVTFEVKAGVVTTGVRIMKCGSFNFNLPRLQ